MLVFATRVRVTGIRGRPPPPTTKVALFYKGGYMSEVLVNANGYAAAEKCDLFEAQLRNRLSEEVLMGLDVLEFQRVGVPASNPRNQCSDTMYIRVVIAAKDRKHVMAVLKAWGSISLRHFSGEPLT
jgi:hypothetical protein